MRALTIVLPILIALLVLLFAKVRFLLFYKGGLRLSVSYLFLRLRLYPRKRRTKKRKEKKKKHSASKPTAKAPKQEGAAKAKGKRRPLSIGDIRFLIGVLREVLATLLEKASRHVRIRIKHLTLTVGGGDDAARAAVEYGLASQSVAYLLAFLESTAFFKRPKQRAIAVRINFLERRHDFSVCTEISCPLIFLIPLAVSALSQFLRAKVRWTRRRRSGKKPQNTANNAKKEKNNG